MMCDFYCFITEISALLYKKNQLQINELIKGKKKNLILNNLSCLP